MNIPAYETKRELLSDIQTLALAGCGDCPRDDPKGGPPKLCRDCIDNLTKLAIAAAYWKGARS